MVAAASKEIIDDKDVGIKEREMLKVISEKVKEKRAYHSIWREGKALLQAELYEELDTMMEVAEENFKEKEAAYNKAVEEESIYIKIKGEDFDKAMTVYNASLNVRFDLDELKER